MKKVVMALVMLAALFVVGALAGVIRYSWAADVPLPLKTVSAGELGTILTGPNGMTLYIFTKDSEGKSVCAGRCAEAWPPFRPGAYAAVPKGHLSIITRSDGTKQFAYKGRPLYYWVKDKGPGDTTGHKVRDVWFVVNP